MCFSVQRSRSSSSHLSHRLVFFVLLSVFVWSLKKEIYFCFCLQLQWRWSNFKHDELDHLTNFMESWDVLRMLKRILQLKTSKSKLKSFIFMIFRRNCAAKYAYSFCIVSNSIEKISTSKIHRIQDDLRASH